MHTYTDLEIVDLKFCAVNPLFWMLKYKILPAVNEQQKEWIKSTEQSIDFGSTRASYRTSTMLAKMMHQVIFSVNRNIAYTSPHRAAVNYAYQYFREVFNTIPEYYRPGVHISTRNKIEFHNGCRMHFVEAKPISLRGQTISTLAVDGDVSQEFEDYVWPSLHTGGFLMRSYDGNR